METSFDIKHEANIVLKATATILYKSEPVTNLENGYPYVHENTIIESLKDKYTEEEVRSVFKYLNTSGIFIKCQYVDGTMGYYPMLPKNHM